MSSIFLHSTHMYCICLLGHAATYEYKVKSTIKGSVCKLAMFVAYLVLLFVIENIWTINILS